MPESYVPKEAIGHGDGGSAALAIGEAESLERRPGAAPPGAGPPTGVPSASRGACGATPGTICAATRSSCSPRWSSSSW